MATQPRDPTPNVVSIPMPVLTDGPLRLAATQEEFNAKIEKSLENYGRHSAERAEAMRPIQPTTLERVELEDYAALFAEKATLEKKLEMTGEKPVEQWPPDLKMAMGRIREIERNLAFTTGYNTQMELLTETWPKASREVLDRSSQAAGRAEPYAEAWRIRNNAREPEFAAYRRGELEAISDWQFDHLARLDVVEKLNSYSAAQDKFAYVNAEAQIANNFATQMARGATEIDLTQAYATGDPKRAAERHATAIENLRELIEQAREQGYAVKTGAAIAQGFQHAQVMAIAPGFSL